METTLRKAYGENSYFYTAMAVIFDWDFDTESNFISLLERKSISEIYLVGNVTNPIYKDLTQGSSLPVSLPWEIKLSEIYSNLTSEIEDQPEAKMKVKLLVADHLSKQIEQMRDRNIIDEYIFKNGLEVKAVVYDPTDDSFMSAAEVSRRALVLKGVCYN